MDYSPPGSSVHGILQARIPEWVAMPFSRGSSQLRNQTWVLHTASRFFTIWATWEALCLCIWFVYNIRVMWILAWNPLPSCSLTSTCNILPRTKFLGRQKRSMTLKSESVEWAFFLSFPTWWKQCRIQASWAQVTGAGAGQLLLATLCPPPRMWRGPHATLIQALLDSSFTFLWHWDKLCCFFSWVGRIRFMPFSRSLLLVRVPPNLF